MPTMVTVEPGIFRRIDPRSTKVLPKLWIHYPGRNGKTEREPAHTTSPVAARKLRAKRMEQHGRGEPGRAAEKLRVGDLLDGVRYQDGSEATTDSLVMRSRSGTVRKVQATHNRLKLRELTGTRYG